MNARSGTIGIGAPEDEPSGASDPGAEGRPGAGAAAPARASRVRQIRVEAGEDGQRLDNWLLQRCPGVPKSRVYRIIRRGEVRVDGARAKPTRRVRAGETVRVPPLELDPRGPVRVPDALAAELVARVSLAHEDFLVVDKPAGLAVHGGTGLAFGAIDALRQGFDAPGLELVHRLDRGTSGALLVARDRGRARALQALFRDRAVDKRYAAILAGRWPEGIGRVALALSRVERGGERCVAVDPAGAPAASRFAVAERFGDLATAVDVDIETGRTHQIRVHAAASGHPVAGDERYGERRANAELARRGVARLCLHSRAIGFAWRGERIEASVAPDAAWERTLEALRRG